MNILVAIPDVKMRGFMMDHPELLSLVKEKANMTWNNTSKNYTYEELKDRLKGTDILLTSWNVPAIDRNMVEGTPLKMIGHVAGTLQNVIAKDVFETGVKIVNGNAAFPRALSEYTLMLILMSLRNAYHYTHSYRTISGFHSTLQNLERELSFKTVGIIGYGSIARQLIHFLKAFNVNILVCDDYCSLKEAQSIGFSLASLKDAMQLSDVISIHHTLTEKTFHLIDRKALSYLKDGAVIVNTARGAIIDQQALIEELKKERIFAALDVFEEEPLPSDSVLRKMDNVLIFPHIAGKTVESRKRMGEFVLTQVLRFLKGEEVEGVIALEAYNRMS